MDDTEVQRWLDQGWLRTPDGRWYRPDPTHCALGKPMTQYQRGWAPCRCGGHAYRRCVHDDHGHTVPDGPDRYRYNPPMLDSCRAPRRMAPTGKVEG